MALGQGTCDIIRTELSLPQVAQPWQSRLGVVGMGQFFVSIKPKAMTAGTCFVEDITVESPYGVDWHHCVTLPGSEGAVLQTLCGSAKTEHCVLQISSGNMVAISAACLLIRSD